MAEESSDPLFRPLQLGDLEVPNRVFMAPLTRSRATDPDGLATDLMVEYYAQRATAGLIISEATNISEVARGYAWTPGIYSSAQVESWQPVTAAVHGAGGRIFCQLWHTGRVSHEMLHPGEATVSASALVNDQCQAFIQVDGVGRRATATPPRALTVPEIAATVDDYAQAAANAVAAGFDGVEVHGANGYLLHQFVAPNVNNRDDSYGGTVANRARLMLEAVDAAVEAIGPGRVALRISPLFAFNGIDDPDPGPAFRYIAEAMSERGIAYLHIADTNTMAPGTAPVMDEILAVMAETFGGPVVLNGGYDVDRARHDIEVGAAAAIAFGRAFLANPDLPARLAAGVALNEPNHRTFYGGSEAGYTDYPIWRASS